jgi:hypothetical protein
VTIEARGVFLTFLPNNPFSLQFWAKADPDYLRSVQKGFSGSGVIGGWEAIATILAVFLFLVLLLLMLRRWFFRPTPIHLTEPDTDSINDPWEIDDIIDRSITLRAVYDVEVINDLYKEIYKGQILGINAKDEIEVELGAFIDPNLDFQDQPVNVAFRMSRRGVQEFYQFNTRSIATEVTNRYGQRERVLRLAIPEEVRIGQKRQYLRVEPTGQFRFAVEVLMTALPGRVIHLSALKAIHQMDINDISIGGLQAVLMARTSEVRIKSGDEAPLHFILPTKDLDVDGLDNEFFVKAKIISVMRLQTGRRVMSRLADDRTVGPHMVRVAFTNQGKLNRKEKTVHFDPAKPLAFENLAKWIQSYQRYCIQAEKGLLPQPDKVPNLYPTQKPDVECKYPPEPPAGNRRSRRR